MTHVRAREREREEEEEPTKARKIKGRIEFVGE